MVTLRTPDSQEWLIGGDDAAAATVHALDALALRVAGSVFKRNEDIELRAVGNFMDKVADVRERRMLGELPDHPSTPEEQAAIAHTGAILRYLVGGEKPDVALDELHAVVFSVDSAVSASGTVGPGVKRGLVRGEHYA